jgi:hypothetical protein
MFKRQNTYLGLHKYPILITDNADYSEYFKVSDLPLELTSGKNFFKLYGNSELLANESEILIEVLDSNNAPIYHHVNRYRDPSGRRVISIYVYDDTPAGNARITILGQAKYRPNGSSIPSNWKDKHNVKWSTVVPLQPHKQNNSEIIFDVIPGVKIQEINRCYAEYDFVIGNKAYQSVSGEGTITNYSSHAGGEGVAELTFAGHIPGGPGGGGFNPKVREISLAVNGLTTANFQYWVDNFISYGDGQSVVFLNPYKWEKRGTATAGRYGHIQTWPHDYWPTWNPTVLYVKDSNTLTVTPLTIPVKAIKNDGSYTIQEIHPNFLIPTADGTYTNFTTSYHQTGDTSAATLNSQSFANITLKNLDPIAGDVYKIKTYMKSQGFGPYTLIGEDLVEDNNLLSDPSSLTPYGSAGHFVDQTVVDNLWELDVPGSMTAGATQSNFPIMGGVTITGSETITNTAYEYYGGPVNYTRPWSTKGILFKSKRSIDVYSGNTYSITFEAAADKAPGQDQPSIMEVWISGSAVTPGPHDLAANTRYIVTTPNGTGLGRRVGVLKADLYKDGNREAMEALGSNITTNRIHSAMSSIAAARGEGDLQEAIRFTEHNALASSQIPGVANNNPYRLTLPGGFTPNTQQVVPGIVKKKVVQINYTPEEDGDLNIRFNVIFGKWHIGNVEIKGDRQTGFTPNHTFQEFPVPTAQENDVLDFKFEFYNRRNEEANIALTLNSVDFSGSNLYIDGINNQLPGTINIGDGLIMEGFDGTL